jgi:hypothetical protein
MLTPEQKAANERVQTAIKEYLQLLGLPADEVMGDWMAIVSSVGWDEEGDPKNAYYLIFANGALQEHVGLGLLAKAQDLMINGYRAEDDEG